MFKFPNYNIILPKYLEIVKKKREFLGVAREWVGWVKGNISFGGAFCFAKYSLKFRQKKEPSQRGRGGRGVWGEFRHARANTKSGQPRRPAR